MLILYRHSLAFSSPLGLPEVPSGLSRSKGGDLQPLVAMGAIAPGDTIYRPGLLGPACKGLEHSPSPFRWNSSILTPIWVPSV